MQDRSSRPGFLLAILVICAALPVVWHLVFRVLPAVIDPELFRYVSTGINGLESVLTLTAVIAFMVFIHGVFKGMRAAGRTTKYSPGMAVGSWFIPFANFVMPALAVAEAYRLRTGKGAGVVALWWLGYLFMTFARIAFQALQNTDVMFDPRLETVIVAAGWALSIATIGTFVLWAVIVSQIAKPNAA